MMGAQREGRLGPEGGVEGGGSDPWPPPPACDDDGGGDGGGNGESPLHCRPDGRGGRGGSPEPEPGGLNDEDGRRARGGAELSWRMEAASERGRIAESECARRGEAAVRAERSMVEQRGADCHKTRARMSRERRSKRCSICHESGEFCPLADNLQPIRRTTERHESGSANERSAAYGALSTSGSATAPLRWSGPLIRAIVAARRQARACVGPGAASRAAARRRP